MSSQEEEDVPPREVCQKRIDGFVEVTHTDEALAQMMLQDHGWDLEKAIQAHFGGEPAAQASVPSATETADSSNPPPVFNTKAPENLNFVTWNIDGLDHKNLKIRTKAVYKLIAQFKIDIVCLQEVIPESYNYLKTKLPEYQFLCENPEAEYFTVVLLRRFVVYLDSFISIDFPGSRMGRKLFLVDCHVGKFKLCILNTHLESTKDHAQERMTQLRQCFKTALDQPETTTVLLAGDLNMRDKELAEVGGAPVGMEDLWIRTGSRKECQFTWDMTRNTNLEFPGRFKPRCRFDRVFMKDSSPRLADIEHFGLFGIEKIRATQCFPSDHWGIHCIFKVKSN